MCLYLDDKKAKHNEHFVLECFAAQSGAKTYISYGLEYIRNADFKVCESFVCVCWCGVIADFFTLFIFPFSTLENVVM